MPPPRPLLVHAGQWADVLLPVRTEARMNNERGSLFAGTTRCHKPRLLDLFCGAGGAAMGYHRAGFDVVGVDIKPQPNYPFEFVQADVIEWMSVTPWDWGYLPFDAIHASPPCQRYSTATKRNGNSDSHPDLIGPVRDLLKATGLPYVIENVVGAPLLDASTLCGSGFNLGTKTHQLRRHRMFEANWTILGSACYCAAISRPFIDVSGGGPTHKPRTDGAGGRTYKGTADEAREAMGIPWMAKAELNEAIPPAYTQFIGTQLLTHAALSQEVSS